MLENNNIFDESSGCIRQDILLKYLKDQLSGKERNLVERHLLECEMCSDELEGLTNLSEPERIIEIEAELNSMVDRRVAPRIILFNPKVIYRVAAVAVLTLGVSSLLYFFVLKHTPSTMMTENQKLESATELSDSQPAKMDVTSIAKDANEFEKIKKEDKRRVEKPAAPIVVYDKVNVAEDLSVSVDSISETLAYEEAVLADEVVVSKSIEKKDSEAIADFKVAMAEQKREEANIAAADIQKESNAGAVAERSKSAKKSMVIATGFIQQRVTTESALVNYNQKNYQQALQDFNLLYAQNSNNDTLIYYRAMCFYHVESYKDAIVGLEAINKNSASRFYYDAQWYYALSLIEIDRKIDAKNLFEMIERSNSPYSKKATEEIEKLRF
ncbi:MAG: hypothetical protein AB7S48_12490 [Bacteroidales bacterium]